MSVKSDSTVLKFHLFLRVRFCTFDCLFCFVTIIRSVGFTAVFRSHKKLKIRVVFEYEFRRGSKTSQAVLNFNEVFGEDAASVRTERR